MATRGQEVLRLLLQIGAASIQNRSRGKGHYWLVLLSSLVEVDFFGLDIVGVR